MHGPFMNMTERNAYWTMKEEEEKTKALPPPPPPPRSRVQREERSFFDTRGFLFVVVC